MQVEIAIESGKAIQLIQVVDGKQWEKFEKCLHAVLTHAKYWHWEDYEKYSNFFSVKRGNKNMRLSSNYYPIDCNFDKNPDRQKKCTRLPGPSDSKNVPTAQMK